MFGNTTIFSNRENASLQCRRFRNIATINEDVFVNRKKVHSINTQIAFDATFNILDVVAKWPAGSTHDPRILMESGLRREAPCRLPWLSLQDVLTPYLSPQPGAQLKYSLTWHTKIHEILWREDVITVITVCAILHNRGSTASPDLLLMNRIQTSNHANNKYKFMESKAFPNQNESISIPMVLFC
ncbi:hypothetical protein N1851_005226 [Merluccius polli]|uniref:DDE Tnp4 domain-containing protein n=1 Tax=Merluccius polli TaxID=89951 RepID=A0AA47N7Q2_MERPO|nr:hypothetical protein N1851_005226 [Merluccius polli]